MRTILILATAAGCSLATVRGPSAEAPTNEAPRCTRNAGLPIVVDGLLALTGIIGGAGGIGSVRPAERTTGDYVGGSALIAGGLLATISAIVGYRRQDACDEAWSTFNASGR